MEIPRIDISELWVCDQNSQVQLRIAKEIDQAFKTVGFFCLTGHNVSLTLIEGFHQSSKKFFSQSFDHKMNAAQVETILGKYMARGYTPRGIESVAKSKQSKAASDDVESFCFRKGACEPALEITKLPQEMVELAHEYWKQVRALDTKLMELCSIALGFDSKYFERYCTYDNALIKCAYYPKQSCQNATNPRYGAHTDYMFLTLLFADPYYKSMSGGLEVWDISNEKWIRCPSIPNSFIVNVGDLLQRLTNDRWIANLHRVAPGFGESVEERLSIVYFNSPDDDAIIESIATRGEKIKYLPIKTSDFFQQKLLGGTTTKR